MNCWQVSYKILALEPSVYPPFDRDAANQLLKSLAGLYWHSIQYQSGSKPPVLESFRYLMLELDFKSVGPYFSHYKAMCKNDVVAATYWEGIIHHFGYGVTKNYEYAYLKFCKSAELGNRDAIYYKGYCLFKGYGCDQSYPEALTCFESIFGTENSHISGLMLHMMGECYFDSARKGCISNNAKALRAYIDSAMLGFWDSVSKISDYFKLGIVVDKDEKMVNALNTAFLSRDLIIMQALLKDVPGLPLMTHFLPKASLEHLLSDSFDLGPFLEPGLSMDMPLDSSESWVANRGRKRYKVPT